MATSRAQSTGIFLLPSGVAPAVRLREDRRRGASIAGDGRAPTRLGSRWRVMMRDAIVAACLTASLLVACEESGGPTADDASPAGAGPAGEPAATLPAGFPADVPVYPGAHPTGSLAATGKGMIVTFQSADAPEKVFSFYRAELAERGWSISGEVSVLGQGALSGTKDTRTASVVIVGATGGTQIIVSAATAD
jgi:hypothetical protein